mgnify:CR=1 FL=1
MWSANVASSTDAAAARAVKVLGAEAVPNYIISMCTSVSDMLEPMILLKEAGLIEIDESGTLTSTVRIVPLFETIEDLQQGAETLLAALDIPITLVTGSIDERLNEHGYIVPGLGDAGDRQFGPR